MSDAVRGGSSPEVGTVSADGSRVWDGRFWVLARPSEPLDQVLEPLPEPAPHHYEIEERGAHLGGVIVGAVLAFLLTHFALNLWSAFAPPADSVSSALDSLSIGISIWAVVTVASAVLILSVGEQGIDVLLLRSMVVAFALAAGFESIVPFWLFVPTGTWLLGMLEVGLKGALFVGPVLTLLVVPLNLLWYRSFRSLRPQLPIFKRRRR
jgi:hypothetical protein